MKTIAIVATGGTIAGTGKKGKTAAYHAGEIDIDSIIETIPEINEVAHIKEYQLMNIDSNEMTHEKWLILKNNIEELKSEDIKFINPFLPFESKALLKRMMELPEFKEYNFNKKELKNAIEKAQQEYQKCRQDIHDKGKETIEYIEKNNLKGIVLAGRPYHVDPEINHGIDTLITSLGMCVLTEDSVADKALPERPLRVVDQWMFHSRLYAAADFVGKHDNLELVQLNSFGCGVDAVTTDQVEEILNSFGKMYTLIKIDEINNLGAVRIRIRSLLASMKKREQNKELEKGSGSYEQVKKIFDKNMKKDYHFLDTEVINAYRETKDNPVIQAQAIKMSTDYEETQEQEESIDKDDDYDLDYN